MKLYDWQGSYNSRKILAIAFETDQKVECIPVNMQAGEHKTAEFMAMNPNGKVPLLVDGNFQLWESNAIACYLAAKDPSHRFLPSDPRQRANVDKWLFWQTAHLSPSIGKLTYERYWKSQRNLGACDEKAVDEIMIELNRYMGVLDTWLGSHQWLADNLSVADFALAVTFMTRKDINFDISGLKNVTGWLARVEERPSWQQAEKCW